MTRASDLAAVVGRLSGVRVLVAGDVMLDRFVHGSVERISPEAPIPVLHVERETAMLGAAGNVVRNLIGLGAEAALVSVVGDDDAGRAVTALLGTLPRCEPHLLIARERETTIKTRYFCGNQQLLRTDRESTAPLGARILEQATRRARRLVADCGALVLSDYAKGLLDDDLVAGLIAAAREAGVPVVVDPKGRNYRRYAGASVVTPNRRELMEATGLPTGTDAEVATAAAALSRCARIAAVLATRGPQGMTLVSGRGKARSRPLHLPASAREVFDVSGAGDTVVATVAAAVAAGTRLSEAAALANAAAGVVVGKTGTAAIEADELISALHARDLLEGEAKVVTLSQAAQMVEGWRRKGQRIGFTNGCFDLLHPGHVSLLSQARRACDRLVVGLNSDASVRRLKGDGRPVQSEAARAAVLGSLASVDLVVIFPEDTPMTVIEALCPDVLVKGADYRKEDVVGGTFVERNGGRVLLADILPGHSTTATIARTGK